MTVVAASERTQNNFRARALNELRGPDMALRAEVSKSWNVAFAQPFVSNAEGTVYSNLATPFRGMMNNADIRARRNYRCANPGRRSRYSTNCDGSGIPTVSGNPQQYWRSSDYTHYLRGRQMLLARNQEAYGQHTHNPVSISSAHPV